MAELWKLWVMKRFNRMQSAVGCCSIFNLNRYELWLHFRTLSHFSNHHFGENFIRMPWSHRVWSFLHGHSCRCRHLASPITSLRQSVHSLVTLDGRLGVLGLNSITMITIPTEISRQSRPHLNRETCVPFSKFIRSHQNASKVKRVWLPWIGVQHGKSNTVELEASDNIFYGCLSHCSDDCQRICSENDISIDMLCPVWSGSKQNKTVAENV